MKILLFIFLFLFIQEKPKENIHYGGFPNDTAHIQVCIHGADWKHPGCDDLPDTTKKAKQQAPVNMDEAIKQLKVQNQKADSVIAVKNAEIRYSLPPDTTKIK